MLEAVLAVLAVALFAKQVLYRPAESSALKTHPSAVVAASAETAASAASVVAEP
jgi:hypothetical protein